MKNKFILGCMNFGGIGSNQSGFQRGNTEQEAHAILDQAFDLGIRTLDTANSYANGLSESYIGSWLKKRGSSLRTQLVLATKVGNVFAQDIEANRKNRTLKADHILKSIEESLARLCVDAVDIYFTHIPDDATELTETLSAIKKLLDAGKIKSFGASNLSSVQLSDYLNTSKSLGIKLSVLQNLYNLIDKSDLPALCFKNQVGFWAYSPLRGGILTGKYQPSLALPPESRAQYMKVWFEKNYTEETQKQLDELSIQAREKNMSLSALSYKWLLDQPEVTGILASPRRAEHFDAIKEVLRS